MVLAAGTFFWLVRALLALSPSVALLWPVKKIAAVAAMIGATVYCVFSGSDVATERSLIMTLVMFGAVLVDRPALSIRNLSIAALIVLAREPEALLGPSFQMSFGAVAAMMALVPLMHRRQREGAPATVLERGLRWVGQAMLGLVTTTLVASIATAPFAAYHFQSLNPYGLIGNALALPLVSLVVMPSAVLGVLAYPFGLDRPVWQVMGAAVDAGARGVGLGRGFQRLDDGGAGAERRCSGVSEPRPARPDHPGLRPCDGWPSCRQGRDLPSRPRRIATTSSSTGRGQGRPFAAAEDSSPSSVAHPIS